MEVRKSVAAEEVPSTAHSPKGHGLWTGVAAQAIEACQEGRVLVVKVKDHPEYKLLRSGLYEPLKKAGYTVRPVIIDEEDGRLVYLKLEPKTPAPTVVVSPIRKPRRRASG